MEIYNEMVNVLCVRRSKRVRTNHCITNLQVQWFVSGDSSLNVTV